MSTNFLAFAAHGIPKGQPRPRAYAMRMGSRYTARMYADPSAADWTARVAAAIGSHPRRNALEPIFCGPVSVTMVFDLPRPKSHFTPNGALRLNAPHYCTTKPDADNLAKLVLDVLTKAGWVWKDDAIVASLSVIKNYNDANPGVGVSIDRLIDVPNIRSLP
jgi:Holliday junction resolvase RusA-like endonuclease